MSESVSYKKALEYFAVYMDDLKLNAFECSTILAMLFGKSKEKTMNDLVRIRQ